MLGAHINDRNRDMWNKFIELCVTRGLSASAGLEQAAESWLRSQGVPVFHDPSPGRTRTIVPLRPGDFEPYEEWAEVAPYVDRWLSPPRVVLDGTDGMDPQ